MTTTTTPAVTPAPEPPPEPQVMFTIGILNESTGAVCVIKGQGIGFAEAFKDGYANATYGHINPSSNGGQGANLPPKLAVVLRDGRRINQKRELFENRSTNA